MNRSQDLEHQQNQFLIRFPQELAQQLNLYLDMKVNVEPQLLIQPYTQREGDVERLNFRVELDGVTRKASLLQLPTITETFKTVDRVNFFKSNDISEMIYVHEQNEDNITSDMAKKTAEVRKSLSQTKKVLKYKAHSGITPPTAFIRQRYFRKKPLIAADQLRSVESELQKIRQDIMAIPRSADEPEQKKKIKRKYHKKFQ